MFIINGKRKFFRLLIAFQAFLILTVILSIQTISSLAQETTQAVSESNAYDIAKFLGLSSAIAVGLCVLGAGYAIKTTGTAAISVLSERPQEFFKAFLVVALGEALAVYGLIIAILLWTKIPEFTLA